MHGDISKHADNLGHIVTEPGYLPALKMGGTPRKAQASRPRRSCRSRGRRSGRLGKDGQMRAAQWKPGICFVFFHYASGYVSLNCLLLKSWNYNHSNCLAFLHCAFLNALPKRMSCVRITAMVAFVRFSSIVHVHMSPQTYSFKRREITISTIVWVLSTVRFQMFSPNRMT